MSNGQQMLLMWLHTGITNLGLSWQPVFSLAKSNPGRAAQHWPAISMFQFLIFVSFHFWQILQSRSPVRHYFIGENILQMYSQTVRSTDHGRVGGWNWRQFYQTFRFCLMKHRWLDFFPSKYFNIFVKLEIVPALSSPLLAWPGLVWSGLVMPLHFIKITNKPCLVTLPILK